MKLRALFSWILRLPGKLISGIKLMFVSIFLIYHPRRLRSKLRTSSTASQYMFLLCGIGFLIFLQTITGYVSFRYYHQQYLTAETLSRLDYQSLSRLGAACPKLRLLFQEKQAGLESNSFTELYNSIKKDIHQLNERHPQFTIKKGLGQILEVMYHDISFSVSRITNFEMQLSKLKPKIQSAHKSRLNDIANRLLFINLGISSIFLLGLFFLIRTLWHITREHRETLERFEVMTASFKEGRVVTNSDFECPGTELQALQMQLHPYFSQINQYFLQLREEVSQLIEPLQELSGLIRRNETQFVKIKQDLEDFIAVSYRKLDSFPPLSERIQTLNSNLMQLELQARDSVSPMVTANDTLFAGPEKINNIAEHILEYEERSQNLMMQLNEVRQSFYRIQMIISIFQNISEQTAVLSLNASIEAARAGSSGDGFDMAALRIDELAEKIRRTPHDLTQTINTISKRMDQVIHTLETGFLRNSEEKAILTTVRDQLTIFHKDLNRILNEIPGYSSQEPEIASRRSILEQLDSLCDRIQRLIPANQGKSAAALEIISKADELSAAIIQAAELLSSLEQALAKTLSRS